MGFSRCNRMFISPIPVFSLSFFRRVNAGLGLSEAVLQFSIFLLYLKSCNLDLRLFLFRLKRGRYLCLRREISQGKTASIIFLIGGGWYGATNRVIVRDSQLP